MPSEDVERAKDALTESLTMLGSEVEQRLRATIDHAADRVSDVAKNFASGVAKTRDVLDVSRRIRRSPFASLATAAVAGFALSFLRRGGHARALTAGPAHHVAPPPSHAPYRPHSPLRSAASVVVPAELLVETMIHRAGRRSATSRPDVH